MNKKVVAKEYLVFISSLAFGILFIPLIICKFLSGIWEDFFDFYDELYKGNFFVWLIAFAPYFIIQIGRASVWSIKQLKKP